MADELKPCPFCGADAEWKEEDDVPFGSPFGLVVEHKADCFFGNHMMAEWETIIAAWNTRPAPKADSALVGELRDQVETEDECCQFGGDGFGGGNIFREAADEIERLAALSDRDVVLEASKRLQKQSDFHDETARRMGQKLRAVLQIVQDEKRKAADIALEGGERAKANESMEAALGRALNRIESELVGAADA